MHQNIDVVEKKPSNVAGGTLILKCKDFRMIKLEILTSDDLNNVAATLETLIAVSESKFLFIIHVRVEILSSSP